MKPTINKTMAFFLISAVGICLAGCSGDISVPVAAFAKTSGQSASVLTQAMTGERSYVQGICLNDLALSGKRLTRERLHNCVGVFTAERIKARLAAIAFLQDYANALSSIASSDGAKTMADLEALGTSGNALADTFNKLSKTKSGLTTSGASYVGPLTTVAGWAIGQLQNYQRDQAIKSAVTTANPSVSKVLSFLKEDMTLLTNEKKIENSRLEAHLFLAYREHESRMTISDRQAILSEIAGCENFRANDPSSSFVAAVDAWSKANRAMVIYLSSPQTPKDLDSFTAAINKFVAQVQPLTAAVAQLQSAK